MVAEKGMKRKAPKEGEAPKDESKVKETESEFQEEYSSVKKEVEALVSRVLRGVTFIMHADDGLLSPCYRRSPSRHTDFSLSCIMYCCSLSLFRSSARVWLRSTSTKSVMHELAAVPIAHMAYRGDDSAAAAAGRRPLTVCQPLPEPPPPPIELAFCPRPAHLADCRRHFIS